VSDVARDIIWKCALVGGLVTASVQMSVAREPLGGQLDLASRTRSSAPTMRVSVADAETGRPERVFVSGRRGMRWTAALAVLWLTSAGVGLLWLTVGHARALNAIGDRPSLDGTPIAARLRALLHRARVNRRVELTCSATLASPVALAGSEICMPRRALLELEPNEQDSMLAHEVAHLVRRDPQWLIAARVIEIVFFVQPLNRLARHRMQEVAEYLCDDWAVSRMSKAVTLAKCLAAVAEWVGRAPNTRLQPMSAMVESGGSPLVRRVGRILSGETKPRGHSARVTLVASACALIALVGAAPRVSVANAALTERTMTFVRAIGTDGARPVRGDTMIVFGGGGPHEVRFRAGVGGMRGATAGSVVRSRAGQTNVILMERRSER
jgi:beta-lactamase regulating signal transducer with metallopeptidase domain